MEEGGEDSPQTLLGVVPSPKSMFHPQHICCPPLEGPGLLCAWLWAPVVGPPHSSDL